MTRCLYQTAVQRIATRHDNSSHVKVRFLLSSRPYVCAIRFPHCLLYHLASTRYLSSSVLPPVLDVIIAIAVLLTTLKRRVHGSRKTRRSVLRSQLRGKSLQCRGKLLYPGLSRLMLHLMLCMAEENAASWLFHLICRISATPQCARGLVLSPATLHYSVPTIQRLRESKSPTNHLTYFGGRICPIPLFRLRVPRQWAAWPRSTLTSSHFPNPHPHPHPSGSFPTPAVLRKNIKADLLEDYKVQSTCSAPRISSMHLVRCPKPDSSSLS